jgi:Protein of unknown function (DUF3293)
MRSFREYTAEALLESGLARIRALMEKQQIGIVSAAKGEDASADEKAHMEMAKGLRKLSYDPIQATGRSQWGPEKSYVVPGITRVHLHQIGNQFGQHAVTHVERGGRVAHQDYLDGHERAGQSDVIPNSLGVMILKGIGFNPKDDREPAPFFIVVIGHPTKMQLSERRNLKGLQHKGCVEWRLGIWL